MTREEFKDGLAIITHPETDLKYFNEWISSITQHDDEQRAEIARLKNDLSHWTFVRFQQLESENNRLREALEIYKNASYQSHNGHWDMTMQGGAGCPECIRARELRVKADEILAKDAIKEER